MLVPSAQYVGAHTHARIANNDLIIDPVGFMVTNCHVTLSTDG